MTTRNTDGIFPRIGIVGGGQLGKMMALVAKRMGFVVAVLDPTPDCPAHSVCDHHVVGAFHEFEAYKELAKLADCITYEFEHISTEHLTLLERDGHIVRPGASVLKQINNKLIQNRFLERHGFPVSPFLEITTEDDLERAIEALSLPIMLKTCTHGYDGKGNAVIETNNDIPKAYESLGSGKLPLMAEAFVNFRLEFSIIICRGTKGNTVTYPLAENTHRDSILTQTIVPADIPPRVVKDAQEIAEDVVNTLDGIGCFCIECFLTHDDRILINEIAPRPHNSGHYTIEGCVTSQFENHVRAIAGLPLGSTALRSPAVGMINLLGEQGEMGYPSVENLESVLSMGNVFFHWYGKRTTKAQRKMGHITIIGEHLKDIKNTAQKLHQLVKVRGSKDTTKS